MLVRVVLLSLLGALLVVGPRQRRPVSRGAGRHYTVGDRLLGGPGADHFHGGVDRRPADYRIPDRIILTRAGKGVVFDALKRRPGTASWAGREGPRDLNFEASATG